MIVDPDDTMHILDRIMAGFGWRGWLRMLWFRLHYRLFGRLPYTEGVRHEWLDDVLEPRVSEWEENGFHFRQPQGGPVEFLVGGVWVVYPWWIGS